jgi:hypothetical protein
LKWPAGILSDVPSGLAGEVALGAIPAAEGAGSRVIVRIGPVSCAFDGSDRAILSATVRAVDRFDNASTFGAHATAIRFEEAPPVVPAYDDSLALASMPDANGRATYTVHWPTAGGGRVRVLRASASALLLAGDADMTAYASLTPNQQAALLRNLALTHSRVFTADHENPYPAEAGAHRARFAARTVGLSAFTVERTSRSEIRSPWPSQPQQFIVVAVRPTPIPLTPLVTELRAGDRSVTMLVASDAHGDVAKLRLYRARDANSANDLRRMRLVREVDVASSSEPSMLTDDGLYADIDYLYRVVAAAADGTPSIPSAVLLARPFTSLPPDPPSILSVARVGTTPRRTLTCEIGRRDQPLMLYRRKAGELGWIPASGPHVTSGLVDVAALTPAPVPVGAGYRIEVQDDVAIDPNGSYVYLLRVRDARGRSRDGDAKGEAP